MSKAVGVNWHWQVTYVTYVCVWVLRKSQVHFGHRAVMEYIMMSSSNVCECEVGRQRAFGHTRRKRGRGESVGRSADDCVSACEVGQH